MARSAHAKRNAHNDENILPLHMDATTTLHPSHALHSPLASNSTLYNMPDPTFNLTRTASLRQPLNAQQAKPIGRQTLTSGAQARETGPGGLLTPPSSSEPLSVITPNQTATPLVQDPTSPSPTRPRPMQTSPVNPASRATPSRRTTPSALSRRAYFPQFQPEDEEDEEEEEDIVPVAIKRRGGDASFLKEVLENGWDQEMTHSPIKITYLVPPVPSPSKRRAKSKTPQSQKQRGVSLPQLQDQSADLSNVSIKSSSSTSSNQSVSRHRRGRSGTATSNTSRRSIGGRMSASPLPASILLGDVTTDRPCLPDSPSDDPLLLLDPNIVVYSGNPNASFRANRTSRASASLLANQSKQTLYANSPSVSRVRSRSVNTYIDPHLPAETSVSLTRADDSALLHDRTLSGLSEEEIEQPSISHAVDESTLDVSISTHDFSRNDHHDDDEEQVTFGQDGDEMHSDSDSDHDGDFSQVDQSLRHEESVQSLGDEARELSNQQGSQSFASLHAMLAEQGELSPSVNAMASESEGSSRQIDDDTHQIDASLDHSVDRSLDQMMLSKTHISQAAPEEHDASENLSYQDATVSSVHDASAMRTDERVLDASFDSSERAHSLECRDVSSLADVTGVTGETSDVLVHGRPDTSAQSVVRVGDNVTQSQDISTSVQSAASGKDLSLEISVGMNEEFQNDSDGEEGDVVDEGSRNVSVDTPAGEKSLDTNDESSRLQADRSLSQGAEFSEDDMEASASTHLQIESNDTDDTSDEEVEEMEQVDTDAEEDALDSSASANENDSVDVGSDDDDDADAVDDDDTDAVDDDEGLSDEEIGKEDDDEYSEDIVDQSTASSSSPDDLPSPHIHTLHLRQPGLQDETNRSHNVGDASHSQSRVLKLSQPSSTPIVEISSLDPRAAARATAILKLFHKYVDEGWLSGADAGDASGMTTATGERMQQLVQVMRRVEQEGRANTDLNGSAAADLTSIVMDAELSLAREDTAGSESLLDTSRATSVDAAARRSTPRQSKSVAPITASPATPFLPGGFRSPARANDRHIAGAAFSEQRTAKATQPPTSEAFVSRSWTAHDWTRLDKYFVTGLKVISRGMLDAHSSAGAVRRADKVEAYLEALLSVDVDEVADRFLDDMQIDARSGRTAEWSPVKVAYRLQALQRKYVKKMQAKYPEVMSLARLQNIASDTAVGEASINTENLNWSLAANTTAHSRTTNMTAQRKGRVSFGTPYRTGAHSTPAAGLKKVRGNPAIGRVQHQANFDRVYPTIPAPRSSSSGGGGGGGDTTEDAQVAAKEQSGDSVLSRTTRLISRLSGSFLGFASPSVPTVSRDSNAVIARTQGSPTTKAHGKRKAQDLETSDDEEEDEEEEVEDAQVDDEDVRPIKRATAADRSNSRSNDEVSFSNSSSVSSSAVRAMDVSLVHTRSNASVTNETSFAPTEYRPRKQTGQSNVTASMRGSLFPTVQTVTVRAAGVSTSTAPSGTMSSRATSRVETTGRQLQGGSSSVSHTPLSLLSPRTHQQAAAKVDELRASREARNWKSPRALAGSAPRRPPPPGPHAVAGRSLHQVLGNPAPMRTTNR